MTGPQSFPNCSAASLDIRRELTQQNPAVGRFIGFLDYFTDHGTQKYNGLLLSVQGREVNGMNFGANYTLSKCLGHPTQGGGTSNAGSGYMLPVSLLNPPADAEDRLDADYGPCDSDRRHILRAERYHSDAGIRERDGADARRRTGGSRAASARLRVGQSTSPPASIVRSPALPTSSARTRCSTIPTATRA